MLQTVLKGRDRGRERLYRRLEIGAAILLVALSILIHRINHDESQYVAAIALMRSGLPYLDFAYLQTPLQPLLYAPLSLVHAGWLLVCVRVANGLLAIATIGLVALALQGRVRQGTILIAVAALTCSQAFLLAASLARNDALPMVLLAAATAALLRAPEGDRPIRLLAVSGLLFGLAASAKINAAVPGFGAALFLVWRSQRMGLARLSAFFLGGLIGIAPCLFFWWFAPPQFLFDVFTYGLEAPVQWWTSLGRANLLSWRGIPELVGLAARGIVLVGVIVAAADRRKRDDLHLLDLMIVGGIVGAYLTKPPYPQYLVPLLVPVSLRFALALDRLSGRARQLVLAATAVSSVIGLLDTAHYILRTRTHGLELVQAIAIAHGAALLSEGRPIVTLAGEEVAGADTNLDPRFAAGPFLFRTSDGLASKAVRFGHCVTWQDIDQALDRRMPGTILVGGETRPQLPIHPLGLDAPLVSWAMGHGYKAVSLGHGFTLFVHP